MSAPDGFLAGAATGAAPGTARTVVPARSGPSNSSFASDFSRDTPFPDGEVFRHRAMWTEHRRC